MKCENCLELHKLINAEEEIKKLQAQLAEKEWIPVEERLPEEGTQVMVAYPYGGIIECACVCFGRGTFQIGTHLEVTHWKTIHPPEPTSNPCELPEAEPAEKKFCEWHIEMEEANEYGTSCKEHFRLNYDTPKENGMKHCPYCGLEIKEVE